MASLHRARPYASLYLTTAMPTASPRLLLAEDDADAADIYRTVFEQAGFEVILATDGASAVAHARALRPAVILMDIGLPGMDGATATAILKQAPETRDIPTIAVTAHVLPEHRPAFLAAGFDHFCEKPCDPRALLAVVQQILYGGPSEETPYLPVDERRPRRWVDGEAAGPGGLPERDTPPDR